MQNFFLNPSYLAKHWRVQLLSLHGLGIQPFQRKTQSPGWGMECPGSGWGYGILTIFSAMVLCLTPLVPLPSEVSPVSVWALPSRSPALTSSSRLYPLLLGNLSDFEVWFLACGCLLPPLVSLNPLYCSFSGVLKGSWRQTRFCLLCLRESEYKFSNKRLRVGRIKPLWL